MARSLTANLPSVNASSDGQGLAALGGSRKKSTAATGRFGRFSKMVEFMPSPRSVPWKLNALSWAVWNVPLVRFTVAPGPAAVPRSSAHWRFAVSSAPVGDTVRLLPRCFTWTPSQTPEAVAHAPVTYKELRTASRRTYESERMPTSRGIRATSQRAGRRPAPRSQRPYSGVALSTYINTSASPGLPIPPKPQTGDQERSEHLRLKAHEVAHCVNAGQCHQQATPRKQLSRAHYAPALRQSMHGRSRGQYADRRDRAGGHRRNHRAAADRRRARRRPGRRTSRSRRCLEVPESARLGDASRQPVRPGAALRARHGDRARADVGGAAAEAGRSRGVRAERS